MVKEYFLTAPLLKAERTIIFGDCTVSLRGQNGYSFIEGSNKNSIGDALDDLITVLIESHFVDLRSLQVVLRSAKEPAQYPDEPKKIKAEDWLPWAFSLIPLKRIPVVYLDSNICEKVEQILRNPAE